MLLVMAAVLITASACNGTAAGQASGSDATQYCELRVTWTPGSTMTIAEPLNKTLAPSCDDLAEDLAQNSKGYFTAVSDGSLASMPTGACAADGVTLVSAPTTADVACTALEQDITYLVATVPFNAGQASAAASASAAAANAAQAAQDQQNLQTVKNDLAEVEDFGDSASYSSDLAAMANDVQVSNAALAELQSGYNPNAGAYRSCAQLQTFTGDATDTGSGEAAGDITTLQNDMGTEAQNIQSLQADLQTLQADGTAAPPGATTAITNAQAALQEVAAEGNPYITQINNNAASAGTDSQISEALSEASAEEYCNLTQWGPDGGFPFPPLNPSSSNSGS